MSWPNWIVDHWEIAAALVGGLGSFAAFSRKRIVAIVHKEVNPEQLHKVLAAVQSTVNNLDAKVDGLTEHVFYLRGRVNGEAEHEPSAK